MTEARVAHQNLDQSLDDGFVLGMTRTRWNHSRTVVRGQLGVSGVEIRVIQMALEDALLEAIRNNYMCHTAVELKHPTVGCKPVAAARILSRPGKQHLAEAKAENKT
jgi:hypothetical protein